MAGYLLPQRAGYSYCFEFHAEEGTLADHGYRRLGHRPAPPVENLGDYSWTRAMTTLGATRQEVRTWLGDPVCSYGWWPIETWVFTSGRSIAFRHGIVEPSDGHA